MSRKSVGFTEFNPVWPIEARRRVLRSFSDEVVECIRQLLTYIAKPEPKRIPKIQSQIDKILFCFSHENHPFDQQLTRLSELNLFKVLNLLASVFNFDVKDLQQYQLMFRTLFLGRQDDPNKPWLHERRLNILVRFSVLAVQYGMGPLFDCIARWVLENPVENGIFGARIVAELCANFLEKGSGSRLPEFLEALLSKSREFLPLFLLYAIDERRLMGTHSMNIVKVIAQCLTDSCKECLDMYSKSPIFVHELCDKRAPMLFKFNCMENRTEECYERLHIGMLQMIIMSQTKMDDRVPTTSSNEYASRIVPGSCNWEEEKLVVEGIAPEISLLTALARNNEWDDTALTMETCRKLRERFAAVTFNYSSDTERFRFAAASFDFLCWLLDGLRVFLCSDSAIIPGVKECAVCLLETFVNFAGQQLFVLMCFYYLKQTKKPIDVDALQEQAEMIAAGNRFAKDAKVVSLQVQVPELIKRVVEGPLARVTHPAGFIDTQIRSGIHTLGTIFACFRTVENDFEVAQTMLVFAHNIGTSRKDLILDLLRSGPLIQLKEKEPGRKALADVFSFLRSVNIVRILVSSFGVKRELVGQAMHEFVRLRALLDQLDRQNRCNFVSHLISSFTEYGLLDAEEAERLVQTRNAIILARADLAHLADPGYLDPESQWTKIAVARRIAQGFQKQLDNDFAFLMGLDRFLMTSDGTAERVLAMLSASGDLAAFALKVVQLNQRALVPSAEAPMIEGSRLAAFSVTFMILARIKYIFTDLRVFLNESEQEKSRFFSWWTQYEVALCRNEPMTAAGREQGNGPALTSMLKTEQPFWDESSDLWIVQNSIIGIGEYLVEQYRRHHGVQQEVEPCFLTLRSLPHLLVCFVQWLEVLPITEHVNELARQLLNVLRTSRSSCHRTWAFAVHIVENSVARLARRKHRDLEYPWLMTVARRTLPSVRYLEVPDRQMLKMAFVYANQQCWACPEVISLIHNTTSTVNSETFILCWIDEMLQSVCADEVMLAAEIFLAAAFVQPTCVLSKLIQYMTDLVLVEQEKAPHKNVPVSPIFARPLAWMLARAMPLLLFAEQNRRRKEFMKKLHRRGCKRLPGHGEFDAEGPPRKQPRLEDGLEEDEDDETEAPTEELVKFQKELQLFDQEQSTYLFDEDLEEEPTLDLDEEPLPTGPFWPRAPVVHPISTHNFQNFSGTISNGVIIGTIIMLVKRLEKQIKNPHVRQTVTFTLHLLQELTRMPRSRFWYKLALVIIKPDFFVNVLHNEQYALTLDDVLRLYDVRDDLQLRHIVYLGCMLRRLGTV